MSKQERVARMREFVARLSQGGELSVADRAWLRRELTKVARFAVWMMLGFLVLPIAGYINEFRPTTLLGYAGPILILLGLLVLPVVVFWLAAVRRAGRLLGAATFAAAQVEKLERGYKGIVWAHVAVPFADGPTSMRFAVARDSPIVPGASVRLLIGSKDAAHLSDDGSAQPLSQTLGGG